MGNPITVCFSGSEEALVIVMKIFQNWKRFRNRRKIENFCSKIGHQTGWSIEETEVQELDALDANQMTESLDLQILEMKNQFVYFLDKLATQCKTHGIQLGDVSQPPITLTLLRADTGSRLQFFGTRWSTITSFKLFYRGVGWMTTYKDDQVEFSLRLFDDLEAKLLARDDGKNSRVWFVRELNWYRCTLNDIEERIKNWEVKKGE